ncbi:hypothetical protein ACIBCN_25065 [Nocardia sp. NPDC051052]|uniref:hypothetical protein n=1 Tax=Nocardia sp. NPDC051052 TaxID=3364322 RepID=UPI00379BFC48
MAGPSLPIPPSPAPAVSWPSAFLTAVIVVAGLGYHFMLVARGVEPERAVKYLMMIAIPLVSLALPSSAAGIAVRTVCRLLGSALGAQGSGGAR